MHREDVKTKNVNVAEMVLSDLVNDLVSFREPALGLLSTGGGGCAVRRANVSVGQVREKPEHK